MGIPMQGPDAPTPFAESLWRVADTHSAHLPFGTQLNSDWEIYEDKSQSFDPEHKFGHGIAHSTSGKWMHVARVDDWHLDDFLNLFSPPVVPWTQRSGDRCKSGRFLLNDPRVGFFHNQRLSYELARVVAHRLRRTLVLPGFFKFPHPRAYDGTQWVPAKRLIDWSALESCYGDVVELEDLIGQCGPDILDDHVTVPFAVRWMDEGAPWINGTRPSLKWRSARGGRIHQFSSSWTYSEPWPNHLSDGISYFLKPFLRVNVAQARTIRAHGLITAHVSYQEKPESSLSVCFVPESSIREEALDAVAMFPQPALGMHMRFWENYKHGSSGAGKGPAMNVEMQKACTIDPLKFSFMTVCLLYLRAEVDGRPMPASLIVASNTDNFTLMAKALDGFPNINLLSSYYSLQAYTNAVSVHDCERALRSVLFDAMVMALVDFFVGNQCSSMSQYIHSLRLKYIGQEGDTAHLFGGSGPPSRLHEKILHVADQWEAAGRPFF